MINDIDITDYKAELARVRILWQEDYALLDELCRENTRLDHQLKELQTAWVNLNLEIGR